MNGGTPIGANGPVNNDRANRNLSSGGPRLVEVRGKAAPVIRPDAETDMPSSETGGGLDVGDILGWCLLGTIVASSIGKLLF